MLNFPEAVIFVIVVEGAISKNMIKKMIATAVAFALVAVCANAQEVKLTTTSLLFQQIMLSLVTTSSIQQVWSKLLNGSTKVRKTRCLY